MTVEVYRCELTTTDNPWDPIDNFDDWNVYDCVTLGYNSLCYLAREMEDTEGMTLTEYAVAKERAIDKIVLNDPLGLYIKVKRKVVEDIGG